MGGWEEESGHRSVQSVQGQPGHMRVSPFRLCTFEGLPVGSDVYYMHVYAPRPRHDKACLIGIFSLAWPATTRLCPPMEYDSVSPSHCIAVTSSSEGAMNRPALGGSF